MICIPKSLKTLTLNNEIHLNKSNLIVLYKPYILGKSIKKTSINHFKMKIMLQKNLQHNKLILHLQCTSEMVHCKCFTSLINNQND